MMKVKIENATDTYYVDDVTNYTNAIRKLEALLGHTVPVNRMCQVDEYGEEFGVVEFETSTKVKQMGNTDNSNFKDKVKPVTLKYLGCL